MDNAERTKGTQPKVWGRNERGIWELRWSEYTPGKGWATKRVSTRTRDRAEADAFCEGFVKEQKIADAERRGDTVRALVGWYENDKGVSPTSSQHYGLKSVTDALGDLVVGELTARHVTDYRTVRRAVGVKDPTIRRELGALVAVLNHARNHRLVSADDVPYIELPPEGAPRDLWLREHQEERLWSLAVSDTDKKGRLSRAGRFIALGLETAARREAIEELTWARVDLVAGRIDYRNPLKKATKKRRAVVPISRRLRPILERAYAERVDGHVIGAGEVRHDYERFMRDHPEWRWVTAHVLRHTWATLAARSGKVTLFEIGGVLADDMSTVEKHYAHHCPDHLRAAVDARHETRVVEKVETMEHATPAVQHVIPEDVSNVDLQRMMDALLRSARHG